MPCQRTFGSIHTIQAVPRVLFVFGKRTDRLVWVHYLFSTCAQVWGLLASSQNWIWWTREQTPEMFWRTSCCPCDEVCLLSLVFNHSFCCTFLICIVSTFFLQVILVLWIVARKTSMERKTSRLLWRLRGSSSCLTRLTGTWLTKWAPPACRECSTRWS